MSKLSEVEQYLNSLFDTSGDRITKSIASWEQGIDYEIKFWRNWIQTKGSEWKDDFHFRLAPRPLEPWLNALLPSVKRKILVLDVGAGPVTRTGTYLAGRDLEIVAVDPLARQYDRIIAEANLAVPVRTGFSFAEDLSARFDPNRFDLVCCTNALDHAIEPMWGILEMLNVLQIDGNIFLSHRRNEAEVEFYSGFHQWNFDGVDGSFVIWNKSRNINVTALLRNVANVNCQIVDEHCSVTITKLRDLEIEPSVYHRKLRAGLLESMLTMSIERMRIE